MTLNIYIDYFINIENVKKFTIILFIKMHIFHKYRLKLLFLKFVALSMCKIENIDFSNGMTIYMIELIIKIILIFF